MEPKPLNKLVIVSGCDRVTAEQLIQTFQERHPGLVEALESASVKVAPYVVEKQLPQLFEIDSLTPIREYKARLNVRVSAKTGHSWPKAKGSY